MGTKIVNVLLIVKENKFSQGRTARYNIWILTIYYSYNPDVWFKWIYCCVQVQKFSTHCSGVKRWNVALAHCPTITKCFKTGTWFRKCTQATRIKSPFWKHSSQGEPIYLCPNSNLLKFHCIDYFLISLSLITNIHV